MGCQKNARTPPRTHTATDCAAIDARASTFRRSRSLRFSSHRSPSRMRTLIPVKGRICNSIGRPHEVKIRAHSLEQHLYFRMDTTRATGVTSYRMADRTPGRPQDQQAEARHCRVDRGETGRCGATSLSAPPGSATTGTGRHRAAHLEPACRCACYRLRRYNRLLSFARRTTGETACEWSLLVAASGA
jgi:hypothetical protein